MRAEADMQGGVWYRTPQQLVWRRRITKDQPSIVVPQLQLAIRQTICIVCEVELGTCSHHRLILPIKIVLISIHFIYLPIPITLWINNTTRQSRSTNSPIQTPSSLRYIHTGRTRKHSANASITNQVPADRLDSPTQIPTLLARRPSHPPTKSCRRTKTHSGSHRLRP